MSEKDIKYQSNMYLYELSNLAKEHGFKAEENWELSLETLTGKAKLQHNFFPTNIAKLTPDILLEVFRTVKNKLKLQFTSEELTINNERLALDELQYLVAYNLKRPRI